MRMCTELVNSTIMEQAAYIRACADQKKLDLNKYKDEIHFEMKEKQNKKKKLSRCSGKGTQK